MKCLNIVFIGLFMLIGCTKTPENIKYGVDNCEYCRMLITENKFGGELITEKGKVYKYDSIECLAAHHLKIEVDNIHSMWVVNFMPPNNLLSIKKAEFLLSDDQKSPMGLNLIAFEGNEQLEKIKKKFGGKKIIWEELVKYVNTKWN